MNSKKGTSNPRHNSDGPRSRIIRPKNPSQLHKRWNTDSETNALITPSGEPHSQRPFSGLAPRAASAFRGIVDGLKGSLKEPEDYSPTARNEANQRPGNPEVGREALRSGSAVHQPSPSIENQFDRLLKAYGALARRIEDYDPNGWSAETIVETALKQLSVDEDLDNILPPFPNSVPRQLVDTTTQMGNRQPVRQLFATPNELSNDRVRIGIASMPGREAGLCRVLEILWPQADEIFVYLNGFEEVPQTLPSLPNVLYFTGPDLGDRGKFFFLEGFSGYYITCDDDIEYAPFHVHSIIDGIERYGREAIVGWHGSIFKPDFEEFYNPKSRQVLSFRTLRGKDTPVHLLGTGVCGFHTSTINLDLEDFLYPNMADAFLAVKAKEQKVPMVVLAHEAGWAKPIELGPSISSSSLKRHKEPSRELDVAEIVTRLIKDNGPWFSPATPSARFERKPFKVAFIGRTDKARWKKGGILKSAHLTSDLLNRFQVETILEDIETGDPIGLSGKEADIAIVYVGDPNRPDFRKVESIVEHHASQGTTVLVNFSINGVSDRNRSIANKMNDWRTTFGKRIRLMIFTEAAHLIHGLESVRDLMVVLPKTISLPDPPAASFAQSNGVFVGDIAKLSDESLLDFPASEWLAAIRNSLPGVPIYAVRQYAPKKQLDLDIDEIWPFLSRETFSRQISRARVMVSAVKYATFEMVPLEVASLGLPVIYPPMPQSLTEYLGLSGISVENPSELQKVLPSVYYDPIVWRSFSQSAIERASSAELNRLAGQTYVRLLSLLNEEP